jgi:uncharacterized membrane protein YphA (DoxX/SURF4 family)
LTEKTVATKNFSGQGDYLAKIDVKPTTSQEIPLAGNSRRSRPHPGRGGAAGLTWLYHVLRLGLACIFIYAGFIKLLDPRAFAHAIAQYDLIPEMLLPLVAVGLPALELLTGAGLIFEVRGSLTIMAILLLIFLVILGYAIWQNLNVDCGCFTTDELAAQDGVITAFRRDLILIGATLFLYWRRRSRAPQDLWIKKPKLLT